MACYPQMLIILTAWTLAVTDAGLRTSTDPPNVSDRPRRGGRALVLVNIIAFAS